MDKPVTKATLKHHLTYSFWKYLLVLAAGILLTDLVYTVTAPQIPENKKIELYVYGYMNDEALSAYLERVRAEQLPEMEEVSAFQILPDETYGPMQLMTYMAAHQGDVFLLPRDNFLSLASEGSFVPLENDAELMAMFTDAGTDLQRGWRKDTETGENHLCGIPQDKLPGLTQYALADNGFLCMFISNGNEENVTRFFHIFCQDMLVAPETEPF